MVDSRRVIVDEGVIVGETEVEDIASPCCRCYAIFKEIFVSILQKHFSLFLFCGFVLNILCVDFSAWPRNTFHIEISHLKNIFHLWIFLGDFCNCILANFYLFLKFFFLCIRRSVVHNNYEVQRFDLHNQCVACSVAVSRHQMAGQIISDIKCTTTMFSTFSISSIELHSRNLNFST